MLWKALPRVIWGLSRNSVNTVSFDSLPEDLRLNLEMHSLFFTKRNRSCRVGCDGDDEQLDLTNYEK